MTTRRNQLLILVACVLSLALLLPALLVWIVDPFRIYHDPFMAEFPLHGNQRYQNAGLINRYLANPEKGYDSIVIGTSMSANNDAVSVETIFGWQKTLRLTVIGGIAEENAHVLRHALATGRVKHVLWEIHPFFYQDSYYRRGAHDDSPDYYFPTRLYNETAWDDWKYLFNRDVLKMSIDLLRGDHSTHRDTLDTIGVWASAEEEARGHASFNSPESLEALRNEPREIVGGWSEEEVQGIEYPALVDQAYPFFREYCNSDIEFVLHVPPWPKYRYLRKANTANRTIYMMRHILHEIAACKNIRLHNFDLMPVTEDLNFFSDKEHFRPRYSHVLMTKMAKREQVLTLDSVRDYENRFIDQLNRWQPYTSYPADLELK